MDFLRIFLLGKFQLEYSSVFLTGLDSYKLQELFCYLILFRNRPHRRELLADLLWPNKSAVKSKSYLRRTLWQLQTALGSQLDLQNHRFLLVESDWIQVSTNHGLWLDIDVLEKAYDLVKDVPGYEIDSKSAYTLHMATQLYQGHLLEGWYKDWCLYERERLQYVYLSLLDKLMRYCEAQGQFDTGLTYGLQILRYDHAREHTHRQLMRLYYLSGNRTRALYQYEQCVTILNKELGVKPTRRTQFLYEKIRQDTYYPPKPSTIQNPHRIKTDTLNQLLYHLEQAQTDLTCIGNRVDQQIELVRVLLRD